MCVGAGRRYDGAARRTRTRPRGGLLFRSHTAILAETVQPLAGRRALEVGCGDGRLLGWLLRRGADAIGADPDAAQVARAGSLLGPGRLIRAAGERLPFADGSFGVVLFFNSLHHVPVAAQPLALAEAARVLRPGGDLVVVEPVADGPWFEVARPLEDETEVRARAREAILAAPRATGGLLAHARELAYASLVEVASPEAAIERFLAANPGRAAVLGRVRPELERRFRELARPAEGGGHAFVQPMRLDHLRKAAP